ncbi:MAG: protein kinase, partial [Planctomycetes bacterium]|nr:protein kinase [Planctomycetota bacterium]
MRAELWHRVDAVLRQLLPLDEATRASAIEDCCGDDEELRRQVESLLQQERDSARLFDVPEGGGERGLGAGDTVGRYRLVRLIAEGGMGEVWLAERSDGHYAEQVAVKLLRSRRAGVGLRRRFQRERQLMVQLVHPGIARLLDGGALPDGRPFLVMEYVDGAPLTEYCDQRQLGVVARIQLFLN